MIQTYFQGRVVVAQAVTFEFVDQDDTSTVLVSYTEGETFDSLDAFIADIQTEINAGGGNLADWTVEIIKAEESGNDAGTVKITTNHAGFDVDFSNGGAGTGTAIRRYLGHNADAFSSGTSPFYFAGVAEATFYPERGALRVTRSATRYSKMQMLTLGGDSFAQFSKDTDDVPHIGLSVSLQAMTEDDDFLELKQFELMLDAIFDDTVSDGEPFTLFHGDDEHTVWFRAGQVAIDYARMIDGYNGAWTFDLSLETWVEN